MSVVYWAIYDKAKNKLYQQASGGFFVFEYPKQALKFIQKRLNNSTNFKIKKYWRR